MTTATLKAGDRISIQEFITRLSTHDFEEVTKENMKELFHDRTNIDVEEVEEDIKDIFVDDYCFTIFQKQPDEVCISSGFNINSTILLSKEVKVYLPNDSLGSMDIEGEGVIVTKKIQDTISYSLKVTYEIE